MPAKHKPAAGVGQALIRHRFHRSKEYENADVSRLHTLDGDLMNKPALVSVIDRSDLDELLQSAQEASRDFTAERGTAQVVLNSDRAGFGTMPVGEKRQLQLAEEAMNADSLTIPRRPPWHPDMPADELDASERTSFLEWRRGLVRLEENEALVLTPFEKNLDIWRQLWRVVERSDLLVVVVDARKPLFYRCPDLEAYVKELDSDKETMLLLNKADLLPPAARLAWSEYLVSHGIGFYFWSAKEATAELENGQEGEAEAGGGAREGEGEGGGGEDGVLGREQLLHLLEARAAEIAARRRAKGGGSRGDGPAVVGFVGYPNVGKSSTINALAGRKKTGVTSTPGKTKHFQTLLLTDHLMLCDCPGLVFPSFTTSRSEMVAAGVLPIDRLTDQRGPVEVVAERVPRTVLESTYGLKLPQPAPHEPQDRPPTPAELLRAYARSRNYVVGSGLPDETRASRQILKDYINGRLLDFYWPPGAEPVQVGAAERSGREGVEEGNEVEEEEEGEEEGGEEEESGGGEAGEGGAGGVLEDFDVTGLGPTYRADGRRKEVVRAEHKMQKKGPRKKDRSWRVGKGAAEEDTDGMPLVRGVGKALSYGASARATVLPEDRKKVGLE